MGKPFAHDAYLLELTSLRDQLKADLPATHHDASNESGPTISELADIIKALKAANTIEATPQRDRQKRRDRRGADYDPHPQAAGGGQLGRRGRPPGRSIG